MRLWLRLSLLILTTVKSEFETTWDDRVIFPGTQSTESTRREDLLSLLSSWESQLGYDRGITKNDVLALNEYGCWCFFQEDFLKGTGIPQDPIDEICKTLVKGYDCIILDTDGCVPFTVPYSSAFASGMAPFGVSLSMLNTECDRQNLPGSCENMTCKVEGWFLLSWFTFSVYGGLLDFSLMHSNGFDHDGVCKTAIEDEENGSDDNNSGGSLNGGSGGNGNNNFQPVSKNPEDPKKCCGDYPKRASYYESIDHACCDKVIYSPVMMECCEDGSVDISCL